MLKLQYFGHLMQRANSLEKTRMLGKIEGRRRRRRQRLDGITNSMDMSLSKLQETVRDFIFLGSKITVDSDCFLLGRKAMTNLDIILKSRDIIPPTEVYLVKAMILPVIMYGCESRTIKKADH